MKKKYFVVGISLFVGITISIRALVKRVHPQIEQWNQEKQEAREQQEAEQREVQDAVHEYFNAFRQSIPEEVQPYFIAARENIQPMPQTRFDLNSFFEYENEPHNRSLLDLVIAERDRVQQIQTQNQLDRIILQRIRNELNRIIRYLQRNGAQRAPQDADLQRIWG